MITEDVKQIIGQQLHESVISAIPVSGGSINAVYCLQTSVKKYLLKLNSRYQFPDMFKREAEGLTAIANTGAIRVPEVILHDDWENKSFLLLEWIDSRRATSKASALLGKQLNWRKCIVQQLKVLVLNLIITWGLYRNPTKGIIRGVIFLSMSV